MPGSVHCWKHLLKSESKIHADAVPIEQEVAMAIIE